MTLKKPLYGFGTSTRRAARVPLSSDTNSTLHRDTCIPSKRQEILQNGGCPVPARYEYVIDCLGSADERGAVHPVRPALTLPADGIIACSGSAGEQHRPASRPCARVGDA